MPEVFAEERPARKLQASEDSSKDLEIPSPESVTSFGRRTLLL
jgi:hypothetical protein